MISKVTNASYESFESKYQSKWNEKARDMIDKLVQPAAISDIKIKWQNMGSNQDDNSLVKKIFLIFIKSRFQRQRWVIEAS